MKYKIASLAVLVSLASLAGAPAANAGGGRGLRADLPCPYGGSGGVNPTLWSAAPGSGSTPIPYNPGLVTSFSATLVSGSNIIKDDDAIDITGATQYDYYASAIPSAADCPGNEFTLNPKGPLEQVIVYKLAAGGTLGLAAGDTEVEFNYNTLVNPSLATTAGTASFTMGGVTYTSTSGFLPTGTLNDFLFDSSGKYLGELGVDSVGNPTLIAATSTLLAPSGWLASGSTGGGGTTGAPELDASSAVSGLTLVLGCLVVASNSRRFRKLGARN